LVDVFLTEDGVLTGSAREARLLLQQTGEIIHEQAVSRKDRELIRKRKVLESKIDSLRSEYESAEEELNKVYVEEALKKQIMGDTISKITDLRRADISAPVKSKTKKTNK